SDHELRQASARRGGRARARVLADGVRGSSAARGTCEQRTGPRNGMTVIGADHGGVELKDTLLAELLARGEEVADLGTSGSASVDYPDYARAVAERISRREAERGILICTNGIGMTIVANKFPGVRAALVGDATAARMAREHNDANVLVLGGGMTGKF